MSSACDCRTYTVDDTQWCAQVLHLVRAHSQAEFQVVIEEAQLPAKLHELERLCEEQGVQSDGSRGPACADQTPHPDFCRVLSSADMLRADSRA